jgi:hypothetical protein
MSKISKAKVTEIKINFNLTEHLDLSKLKNLKSIEKQFYTFKKSKKYDNKHFVLKVDYPKNTCYIKFDPSSLLNSDLTEAENHFKIAGLILKNCGLDIYIHPIHSFKYEGFEKVKKSPEEFVDNIKTVDCFKLIGRGKKQVTFHVCSYESDYKVYFHDSDKKMVKHELHFKNAETILERDFMYFDIEDSRLSIIFDTLLQSARNGINYNIN